MGMDVYGKNAKNEKGEYFRNNVWWWHPLWDYCLNVHGDIAGTVEYGHSNDGDGLDADEAYALGMRLMKDIEDGFTAEYETQYRERLASLPRTDCQWCEGTGIRTDLIGVENGMPTKELDEDDAILLGRSHGWCNGCRGEGKNDAWEANYPFSVENVREFAEFLLNSGGFEIC
jgi:hypothetical protein